MLILILLGLPVRLVDGNGPGEGRVEIYYNNSWATVCNDGWDDTEASVICKQLGVSHAGSSVRYSQGTGTILLDDLNCNSDQSNIFDCVHNGFENHDCSHSDDAGVKCSGSFGKCNYHNTVRG